MNRISAVLLLLALAGCKASAMNFGTGALNTANKKIEDRRDQKEAARATYGDTSAGRIIVENFGRCVKRIERNDDYEILDQYTKKKNGVRAYFFTNKATVEESHLIRRMVEDLDKCWKVDSVFFDNSFQGKMLGIVSNFVTSTIFLSAQLSNGELSYGEYNIQLDKISDRHKKESEDLKLDFSRIAQEKYANTQMIRMERDRNRLLNDIKKQEQAAFYYTSIKATVCSEGQGYFVCF